MKKVFILLALVAFTVVSCTKEKSVDVAGKWSCNYKVSDIDALLTLDFSEAGAVVYTAEDNNGEEEAIVVNGTYTQTENVVNVEFNDNTTGVGYIKDGSLQFTDGNGITAHYSRK